MNITFNELRHIKDSLPSGSMQKIASKLDLPVDKVRNYFGGTHYDDKSNVASVHYEAGPYGGIVHLDDTIILDTARTILNDDLKPS